jgi:hypothetical protein
LDFLDIDHNHPLIYNSSEKNLLNTIVYSTDIRSIKNTYTKAIKRTDNLGIKDEIIRDYNNAIKCIKNY